MRWRENLPKWHPLHREKEAMPMSPGTERAIVRLSEEMPRMRKELERLNDNLEKLETVTGFPERVKETVDAFKEWASRCGPPPGA
jgi:hypothetical protein